MHKKTIRKEQKIAYWLFFLFFILSIGLKFTTIFLTMLFSLLSLNLLTFKMYKKTAIIFFLVLVISLFIGFGYFINQAVIIIPDIAKNALPDITQFAKTYKINIPFSDIQSLKETIITLFTNELSSLAKFAKLASKELLYLIIGIVISIGIFITPRFEIEPEKDIPANNFYSTICFLIGVRCINLFFCFKQVMGAQIIISLINTFFTGIFIYLEDLPYFELLIISTFLCGLIPIVGNIISNCIIFLIASTISLTLAIHALIFLIILHQTEYFLNSKIIGGAIKNPMWLTLLSLVIGERLIGIPGLILAPVLLQYIRKETQSHYIN